MGWPRNWPRKSYTSVDEFWEKSPHRESFQVDWCETLSNVLKERKPGDRRVSYFLRCNGKKLERLGDGKEFDDFLKNEDEIGDVVEQCDIYDEKDRSIIALSLHVIGAGNRAPMGCSRPMNFGIFNRYVIERDENGKAVRDENGKAV